MVGFVKMCFYMIVDIVMDFFFSWGMVLIIDKVMVEEMSSLILF